MPSPVPASTPAVAAYGTVADLTEALRAFRWEGRGTAEESLSIASAAGHVQVPLFVNEFWTSRQRAAHSLHEVSYRACFKPQLPRFFIERLTEPGARVYDPFSGRGTTALEAALLQREPVACDVNPLSRILLEPRLSPPEPDQVAARLAEIPWDVPGEVWTDLEVFFHPETLVRISALRRYLQAREAEGTLDLTDRWIRMVAVNRLTGHSAGFFSVYTLPPNQAVSLDSQARINERRGQTPPLRDVPALILRKTRTLLGDCRALGTPAATRAQLLTGPASATPEIADASIDLVVTSPPFLDVVDYAGDNWLRCWFCGIDPSSVAITITRRPEDWQQAMTRVFGELHRVLRPGGVVAFEVGEVRGGRLKLEELVMPAALGAGLQPRCVVVNAQTFTKTANCWGVSNNAKGTNTNRIVVLQRAS